MSTASGLMRVVRCITSGASTLFSNCWYTMKNTMLTMPAGVLWKNAAMRPATRPIVAPTSGIEVGERDPGAERRRVRDAHDREHEERRGTGDEADQQIADHVAADGGTRVAGDLAGEHARRARGTTVVARGARLLVSASMKIAITITVMTPKAAFAAVARYDNDDLSKRAAQSRNVFW